MGGNRVLANYHNLSQFLEGGGSGQIMTVYDRGGGSLRGPKNYDVIFAQPHYQKLWNLCGTFKKCQDSTEMYLLVLTKLL